MKILTSFFVPEIFFSSQKISVKINIRNSIKISIMKMSDVAFECKPMAVSFQCMTKFTTNKKKKRNQKEKKKKKRCSMIFNNIAT